MEMPCPCGICGNWFDLHDGVDSEKWRPNEVICADCGEKEAKELERDQEIEDLKLCIEDAEYTIKDCKKRLSELGVTESTP